MNIDEKIETWSTKKKKKGTLNVLFYVTLLYNANDIDRIMKSLIQRRFIA